MNLDERNNLIALVNDAGEYQSLLGMDYSEGGEVEDEPPDDGEQVQEFADGGEVVGDPLFDQFKIREAAANAYTNPIINQPAVGPVPVGQQPVSIPTALTTPPLPTALSTMQQPQGSPTTAGFAPVTTGAATTLSASDMLSNIPTFASTARTLPTTQIATTPTLEKPVLRAEKDLPKPVINLAPPDILQKYGGTPISFDRPTDVAAYLTPDGLSKVTGTTTGTTTAGGYTAPAEMKTPGGYTYTNYQSFTPENVSGTKAQVTELFAGATKQQQSEADAIRAEYNKAVSTGNWGLAGQLNDLLKQQEADVTRSKEDFTAASKYFTGAGGAYELPTGFQTRREADYFKQQGLTGYTGLDIGSIGFTPETKADPFTQALSQQQKEFNTANSIYGELSKQFGATSDIAKNYFTSVVTPQKEQYEQINKMAGDVGKANLYGTITGAAGYKDFSPLKLAEIRNEAQTTAAFAPTIKTYETNVGKLTAARDQADRLGLGGYASQLNQLLDKENSRLDQARGARQSAIDQAQPDPMRDLILGKQMAAQKITGFTGVDLPDQDYSRLNAAQAFDPVIQRQNADYQAALGTYNQLKSLYGDRADVTKNFFSDVVTPQKQELDQANLIKANANSALGFINKGYPGYSTPNIAISAKTTEDGVRGVFKNALTNIDNSVRELETAISKYGDQTGVGYYSDALRRKIDAENAKRDRINSDIDMFINKIPGRAKGSPPEGEISNPVAKMVAEQSRSKDQGMDSKSKAMLKKFAGGGEAVASSSPTSQEFPLNEKLYATGEARSLESTELPLIGKVARFIEKGKAAPEDAKAAINWIANKLSGVKEEVKKESKTYGNKGAAMDILNRGLVTDYLGSAVDVPNAVLQGADFLQSKIARLSKPESVMDPEGKRVPKFPLSTDKPYAGKEAWNEAFKKLGVTSNVERPIAETATSLLLPFAPSAAMKIGKKALKELGPTAARMMEKQMEPYNLYAVKPDGGTFFPEGSNSGIDEYLDRVVKYLPTTQGAATVAGKDMADVAEFIRKKGRKYFTSEYGTADDTLRIAAMDGRLPLYNEDKEYFRGYALKAARDDSAPGGILNQDAVDARMDLESLYDKRTGMAPYAFSETDDALDRMNLRDRVTNKIKEKMLEQGVLPDHVNVPGIQLYKPSDASKSYTPDPAKKILSARPFRGAAQGQGDIDRSLQYALSNEEPIYDLSTSPSLGFLNDRNVAEGIMTIPAKERNNMSFPEAIIKGEKNLKFEKDWQLVVAQARKGKPLPKKTYMEGTEPLYNVNDKSEWVRVVTPNAVELEGAAMGHSVGDYKTKLDYGQGGKEAFKNGTARVFSLRNDKGIPSLTVETTFKNDEYKIHQVKSVFNSEPSTAEKKIIFELFDKLRPTKVHTFEKYRRTRAGEDIPEEDQIKLDWSTLYNDYKLYKNKDGE